MKITAYPAHTSTTLAAADVFITDGVKGTKKITKSDLSYALFEDVPEMHSQIFRGKNIGTSLSSAQAAEISSGRFHDMWIGDYWYAANVKWTIIDFNYFNAMGVDQPHLIVMPMSQIGTEVLDTSKSGTINGFADCSIVGKLDTNYTNAFSSVFGSTHLKDHPEWIGSGWTQFTPTGGKPDGFCSNTVAISASVMIPSEIQLFGARINAAQHTGSAGNYTTGYTQFRMFNMGIYPPRGTGMWLRDQTWSRSFAAYIPNHNRVDDRDVESATGIIPYGTIV